MKLVSPYAGKLPTKLLLNMSLTPLSPMMKEMPEVTSLMTHRQNTKRLTDKTLLMTHRQNTTCLALKVFFHLFYFDFFDFFK